MESKLSKAEKTRQFIIETTADIFNTKGYAGTSMSDITDATRLTKGSIYGNFENKEDVALAVFEHNYSKVRQVIRERIAQATTFHQKLMVYVQVYDHFTRTAHFPRGGCPILNTSTEADDTNPLLKERAAKAVLEWKQNIQDLIKEGINAKEFKFDVDDERIALSLIALIEGGIMIAKVTDSQSNLNRVMKTAELLIKMIRV
ncbi:TetR/AcrR family transcriptional regulator [Mucilaginibacter pedocola]|uniref:Transcriptional regulator n=1 Tax=Mucilaginibacter pedocola TaxID=1792845 RepID=A0A1S9PAE3_9SPHI|nr:TetR/AcrR family transcriptional regulator [Mucilaginibacter pedocola]OOQ57558.1 transcriptional regulator [Mucilaginibacter pedocola]